MNKGSSCRRKFLEQAGSLLLSSCWSAKLAARADHALSNPVGYATIAWPEQKFPQALAAISALGFKGVQMLGWVRDAYQGSRIAELKERLQTLKLQPVALSCSEVNLNPVQSQDESREFRAYADFFQRLGGRYLQVTDGGQPERKYSGKEIEALATRINALGKLAQDFGLALGYHPHLGTFGETREGLGRVLDATDPRRVKLIADVAHLALGGADPAEVIRTYHQRLAFTHFKDARQDAANLARKNRALARNAEHRFCEIGTGVVDFAAILRAFGEVNFRGWIIIELDGEDVEPGGPSRSARSNKEAAQKLGLRI